VARHIKGILHKVEQKRSREGGPVEISSRAYFQVFSMLIEYGIAGFEYLNRRKLSRPQREEYFNDIQAVAKMMTIDGFPVDYHQYLTERTHVVVRELQFNARTRDLLAAYRKSLGPLKYWGLLQFQARFIDPILSKRLGLKAGFFFGLLYDFYPLIRFRTLFNGMVLLFLGREGHSDLVGLRGRKERPA
jgi:hypothetical protein